MSTRTAGPTFFPPLGPAKMAGAVDPRGWDRGMLGGQVLPGHTSVIKGGIRLKKDPKKKAGADGCRPTYHGLDLGEMEIEVITYSDDDRELLASIIAPLKPLADREPKPVSFDHPSVRHLGVANVVVIAIGALIPIGPGVTKMLISLDHWQPPKSPKKSATKTPTRAVRNVRAEAAKKAEPTNLAPTARAGFGAPPPAVK